MLRESLHRYLAALDLPPIDRAGTDRLLAFLDELLRWNAKHNLTAITDQQEVLEKHLVDSLSLLPLVPRQARMLDVGSGAGLPGLVLKCVRPDLELVSVDAVGKKISFQRHVIRLLGLSGARAEQLRIERLGDCPQHRKAFDLVVFRALGRLDLFLPLMAPCLAEGGRVVAMKGPEGGKELAASRGVLDRLGLECMEIRDLVLPQSGSKRALIVLGGKQKN